MFLEGELRVAVQIPPERDKIRGDPLGAMQEMRKVHGPWAGAPQ